MNWLARNGAPLALENVYIKYIPYSSPIHHNPIIMVLYVYIKNMFLSPCFSNYFSKIFSALQFDNF